jgi:hypothetical protein
MKWSKIQQANVETHAYGKALNKSFKMGTPK